MAYSKLYDTENIFLYFHKRNIELADKTVCIFEYEKSNYNS